MVTVQYNGPERTIGPKVWYPGEVREATAKQLDAWQAEHGDAFVVVGSEAVEDSGADTETDEAKTSTRKKATK
jgi:hypothetical protein